jgi:glycosyltransferase involved in cell wall biosynthesis
LSRPRILQILTRLGAGGSARHAVDLSARLRDEFDVYIAAGPEEECEGSLRPLAAAAGIPVALIPSLRRRGSLLTDRRAAREIADAIRQIGPALVHTHQSKAGVLGRMAAGRAGVRGRVHTFHSPLERMGRDGLLRRANATAERRLARFTDRLIAVSVSLREELIREGVANADRIEVVHPIIDARRLLQPREAGSIRGAHGIPAGVPVVGLVGRLAAPKDAGLFLEVFAILAASLPEARAVVAGDGPERPSLEAEARRRGLAGRVIFTGWADDPGAVMADIDLLLLTSRYEGFALAAVEAMAAGKPVVGTSVTGVVDVVRHGRTGLLAPAGDAAALAGAAIALLGDDAYRSRLVETARADVEERLSSFDAAARISSIYRSVLGLPVYRPKAASLRAESA